MKMLSPKPKAKSGSSSTPESKCGVHRSAGAKGDDFFGRGLHNGL
jgi:hypothetical protein